uniref:Uncharacterized protein n=3 Tax=Zea mays TaxID=4577 RepID=A0A804N9J9_MAIZE
MNRIDRKRRSPFPAPACLGYLLPLPPSSHHTDSRHHWPAGLFVHSLSLARSPARPPASLSFHLLNAYKYSTGSHVHGRNVHLPSLPPHGCWLLLGRPSHTPAVALSLVWSSPASPSLILSSAAPACQCHHPPAVRIIFGPNPSKWRRRGGAACRRSESGTTTTTAAARSSPRPRHRRSWRPAATSGSSTRRPRGSHRRRRRPAGKFGGRRPTGPHAAAAASGPVPRRLRGRPTPWSHRRRPCHARRRRARPALPGRAWCAASTRTCTRCPRRTCSTTRICHRGGRRRPAGACGWVASASVAFRLINYFLYFFIHVSTPSLTVLLFRLCNVLVFLFVSRLDFRLCNVLVFFSFWTRASIVQCGQ